MESLKTSWLGGDEFAIILENLDDPNEASDIAETIPGMNAIASLLGQSETPGEITSLAKADFDRTMKAVHSYSVSETTTDANASATFPKVPAGTYYLYGRF